MYYFWGLFLFKQMILRGIAHKRYCLLVVSSKAAADKRFSLADICGGEECTASHRRFSAQKMPPLEILPEPYPSLSTARNKAYAILLLM